MIPGALSMYAGLLLLLLQGHTHSMGLHAECPRAWPLDTHSHIFISTCLLQWHHGIYGITPVKIHPHPQYGFRTHSFGNTSRRESHTHTQTHALESHPHPILMPLISFAGGSCIQLKGLCIGQDCFAQPLKSDSCPAPACSALHCAMRGGQMVLKGVSVALARRDIKVCARSAVPLACRAGQQLMHA